MEKWAVEAVPTEKDPCRYALLFKGDLKDILAVIREFGSKCGRPRRTDSSEGFNYQLFISYLDQGELDRLTGMLTEFAPGRGPERGEPFADKPAPSVPEPVVAPPAPEPAAPEPVAPPPQAALPPAVIEAPSPASPPPTVMASLPVPRQEEPPPTIFVKLSDLPPPSSSLPPLIIEQLPLTQSTEAPEPVKTAAVQVPSTPEPFLAGPELPALAGQPPLFAPLPATPSAPIPTPTGSRAPMPPTPGLPQPGAPEMAGAAAGQAPSPAPAPTVSLTRPTRATKPLWGLGMALDEKTNLESILVGPYNRFSHAAAASVVGAPGNMYNPLFVFGPSGVGKSHMLRAIGTGLESALGGSVLFTSGVRLANAVGRSLEEGKYPELEKRFAQSKALLVDDLHLLNVTDLNKASLAKIFGLFFSKNMQVVLTSYYPARSLGSLEESLKISLRKGWSVDMKLASGDAQKDMVLAAFTRSKTELTNDEVGLFVTRIGKNYADLSKWVRRFITLRTLLEAQEVPSAFDKVLQMLFPGDPAEDAKEIPTPQEAEAAKKTPSPAPGANPANLAFVFPKGVEFLASFVTAQFYEIAARNRIAASYKHVLFGSYDADQPLGVPFQIGEMCRKAGADAALVVGPPSISKLAPRLGEFSHAVGHILDELEIPCAWLPHDGLKVSGNYLRAHLDFMARME
ncbi:MAG: ATP-binding protein [Elusimicrobia bacterium]|nr:ATP-binding protein [Elusimicrobiota bacterium]